MSSSVLTALGYLLIPVVAVILGGVAATLREFGDGFRSCVQHFAGGVVFAALAVELLPEMIREHSPIAVILGFVLGVGLMLLVKWLARRSGVEAPGEPTQPTSLIAVTGVDLLIDGLLVGVGFAVGAKQGVLITIALSLEVLFVGLAAATSLAKAGANRRKMIGTVVVLGVLLGVGGVIGVTALSGLSGFALEAVLSFGAVALLYLVTEELLVEAHEVPETPLTTTTFFGGFLLLLLIDMLA